MKDKKLKVIKDILIILIGAIILSFMAFYNKFPLIFFDTGSYIGSGFNGWVSPNRPIFYGLFIRHVSLSETLWFVVFTQSLIISYLIFQLFKLLCSNRNVYSLHLISIFILTLFTGISVNTSQLMPDIFTPVVILCLLILLMAVKIKKSTLIIISIIFMYGLTVHITHLYIIVLALIIITVLFCISKFRNISLVNIISIKRLTIVWSILIFSWITVPTVHYLYGGGFRIIKSSHIFIMASLIEKGLVDDFLDRYCQSNNYILCPYKDKLPTNFIWDKKSPLHLTGSPDENKEEYNRLINDILCHPKYFKKFIIKSIHYTFQLFFNFETGDTPICKYGTATYSSIDQFFPDEIRGYQLSNQINGKLDFTSLNARQNIIVFISFFILLLLLFNRDIFLKLSSRNKLLIILIITCLFFNASLCSVFSTIAPRYQSRVIWLVPLIIIFIFSDQFDILISYYNKIKKK